MTLPHLDKGRRITIGLRPAKLLSLAMSQDAVELRDMPKKGGHIGLGSLGIWLTLVASHYEQV